MGYLKRWEAEKRKQFSSHFKSKQKEIVFGNSAVLSHVAWDSDPGRELEVVVITQQQIIGSPNIIMRFLTLTVKSLIFYRTIKRTDFCTSSAPKYHCRCPRKQFS